jgi:hypothetical protein
MGKFAEKPRHGKVEKRVEMLKYLDPYEWRILNFRFPYKS